MLFARVCKLTMDAPGPICSIGHKRVPNDRSQDAERRRTLIAKFPFPRRGFSMQKRSLLFVSVGVIVSLATLSLTAQAAGGGSFATPLVMGFPSGDDWEPAVASDGLGHAYVLITHFGGVPGCGGCADPSILVQVSADGGAAIAPDGTVYMVWELIHQSGNALGPQDVIVTKSTDKGLTWTISFADQGLSPGPACPESCGWDFLGTGSQIAVDGGGTIYVLYNAPATDGGPPLVWFRSSSDGGAHWTARMSVSTDATPSFHVFPTIDAGAAGDVRIAWMDNRTGAYNVWYRSSSDRGQQWFDETRVSQFRRGYTYVTRAGFGFPYGDYFVLALDPKNVVHIAWGEGPNYSGPGNVLYTHN